MSRFYNNSRRNLPKIVNTKIKNTKKRVHSESNDFQSALLFIALIFFFSSRQRPPMRPKQYLVLVPKLNYRIKVHTATPKINRSPTNYLLPFSKLQPTFCSFFWNAISVASIIKESKWFRYILGVKEKGKDREIFFRVSS
jgi:hypothetical protein